jgi:hypothetical protein
MLELMLLEESFLDSWLWQLTGAWDVCKQLYFDIPVGEADWRGAHQVGFAEGNHHDARTTSVRSDGGLSFVQCCSPESGSIA